MNIRTSIIVLTLAVATTGCNSLLWWKDHPAPPPPPPVKIDTKAATDAIKDAAKNAAAVGDAALKVGSKVDAAKASVDDMAPIVAAGVKQGGEAAGVASAIDPLQEAAAKDLASAQTLIAELKKQHMDLTGNLIKAEERIKVVDKVVLELKAAQAAHAQEDIKREEEWTTKFNNMEAAWKKEKAKNEGTFGWLRWFSIVVCFFGLILAGVWLAAFKDRVTAGIMATVAVMTPFVYFATRGIFKAEETSVKVVSVFVFMVVVGGVVFLFKNRAHIIKLVAGMEYQKDKVWNDTNKLAVTKILGDTSALVDTVKESGILAAIPAAAPAPDNGSTIAKPM